MAGGLVGYLGYDMVRLMERAAGRRTATLLGVPEALMMRPTLFAIFDNVNDELTLVAPVYPRADVSRRGGLGAAQARLDEAEAALERPLPHPPPPVMLPDPPAPASNFTKAGVPGRGGALQGVHRRRRCLPDRARASASPCRSRCRRSRCTARCGGSIRRRSCSSSISAASPWSARSPEMLVRLRDGTVTIRPLAGTRRRGATHEEDQALEAELLVRSRRSAPST